MMLRLRTAVALPIFASTLFLSAGLMFLVEPMVAKMVLPRLGAPPRFGARAFCSSRPCCFLDMRTPTCRPGCCRAQCRLSCTFVYFSRWRHWCCRQPWSRARPRPINRPFCGFCCASLCYAVLLCSSSRRPRRCCELVRGHGPDGRRTPISYAVSNGGSLLALLAYPLIIEPALPLNTQSALWSVGFGALALGLCFAPRLRCRAVAPLIRDDDQGPRRNP